jgi:hypothetical protein
MRKYQAIWEQIKKDNIATVACAVPMHNRIVNGVRKEKKNDVGFKYLMSENNKKCKLIDISDGDLIKFSLESTPTISIHTL